MTFAMNEVEATAKRATRGAGYVWGLAEEAAKATRWLCVHGFDGASELAATLNRGMAKTAADHTPVDPMTDWQASDVLCPLTSGASLSDFASRLKDAPLVLRNVASPAMLLPFAAMAARQLDGALTLKTDGFTATFDPQGFGCDGACPEVASMVSIQTGGSVSQPTALLDRASPSPAAWATLNAYAHKTFAPATEESRRLGAGGAELTDND
ncbi:Protein of unknown function [Shimia gijangensis]|uniref:DUF3726 domain-containing protein n=1 Tax=Shimia gijangensis TaxID=1470563 RepID=A0A1M6GHB2_9RHOB|nr:DUF3726 domain-containing protein [Shimia gijangensis]SHJ09347.1 Protein of unknown function [Shimia gijangensis]